MSNNKDAPLPAGEFSMEAAMLARLITEAAHAAAREAAKAVREENERQRKAELKDAHYNTRLLLRNYHRLVAHGEKAVCRDGDVPARMQTDDDLETIFARGEVRLEGLLRSKNRTRIMVAHMKVCLEIMKETTEDENITRWRAFDLYWLDPDMQSMKIGARVADICDRLNDGKGYPSDHTVRNWIDDMVVELSALLWGIDGLSDKNTTRDLTQKAGAGTLPKRCQKGAL